jgi:two-component system response regulator YesN
LIETDLTISEIALMFGYNDPDHIARFFKKEKNVTPKQFRNTYGLKKRYDKMN